MAVRRREPFMEARRAVDDATHQQPDALDVGFGSRHLPTDLAGVDHDDAVGERKDLLELVGDQQDGDPAVGSGAQTLADELDRSDVETAARLGGDQHGRFGSQLASEHDPLLIAAGQRREQGVWTGAVDAEFGDQLLRSASPGWAIDAGEPGTAAELGEGKVVGDAEGQNAPGIVAILGDQSDPGSTHCPGTARRHDAAPDLDGAGGEREQAAQDVGELGLSVALDAGDADDLAGMHVEGQVIEDHSAMDRHGGCGDAQCRRACLDHGRHGLVDGGGLDEAERQRLAPKRDGPSDHRLGERPTRRHRGSTSRRPPGHGAGSSRCRWRGESRRACG